MNNYPCNNVKVPISGWVDLHPFKAWCLQILPTIFDESMSYYECLCKLLDIVSATIDDVNLLGQEFVKLKEYVDNYFNNLDVQTEINNKLDQMASSGELFNLMWNRSPSIYQTGKRICFLCDTQVSKSHRDLSDIDLTLHLASYLKANLIDLSENGASLLGNSGRTYYTIYSEYLKNNPEPNYVILFPGHSDCAIKPASEGIIKTQILKIMELSSAQVITMPLIPIYNRNPLFYNIVNKMFIEATPYSFDYPYFISSNKSVNIRNDGTYSEYPVVNYIQSFLKGFGLPSNILNNEQVVLEHNDSYFLVVSPIASMGNRTVAMLKLANLTNVYGPLDITISLPGYYVYGIGVGQYNNNIPTYEISQDTSTPFLIHLKTNATSEGLNGLVSIEKAIS